MELPKNITPSRMSSVVKHSENLVEALKLLEQAIQENETTAVIRSHAARVQEALKQIEFTTTPLQHYINMLLDQ